MQFYHQKGSQSAIDTMHEGVGNQEYHKEAGWYLILTIYNTSSLPLSFMNLLLYNL